MNMVVKRLGFASRKVVVGVILALIFLTTGGGLMLRVLAQDGLPTVQFTTAGKTVGEAGQLNEAGTPTGKVIFTVRLSRASSQTVTVNYQTFDSTATSPADFIAVSSTLTFLPGVTEKKIEITIVNDTVAESTEQGSVKLSSPLNCVLGTLSEATFTIIDDDGAPPTVQFASSSYTVAENGGSAEIEVTLSALAPTRVTVHYETSDGPAPNGATAGSDYVAKSGSLTIEVGQTSNKFSVTILPDSFAEADETVGLKLTDPSGATMGTPSTATLTIMNIDPPPWGVTVSSHSAAICAGGISSEPHQTTITARLVNPATGLPVEQSGVSILFSTTAGGVSPSTATTDSSGRATTTLTSGNCATEGSMKFYGQVTAQVGPNSANTQVEFQPTSVTLTTVYATLAASETTDLTALVRWHEQGIASHSLGWRISRIWDEGGSLVYDGTGSPPAGYAGISAGASTTTNSAGKGYAVYASAANVGEVELEASDQSVSFFVSGDNPKANTKITLRAVCNWFAYGYNNIKP